MTGEKKNNIGLKLILATVVVTALVFAWTTSNYKSDNKSEDTWVDYKQHLHVLGITLGESLLRDAETILKSRSDIALYIYPEEHPDAGLRLEAFFPAIADHSKVILELVASDEVLLQIQQRSTMPHLYENRVARMNLHPEDITVAQQLVVKKLTLIPSIEITTEMLKARFGEPSSVIKNDDGTSYYDFASIGLKAMLKEGDASRLFFTNP